MKKGVEKDCYFLDGHDDAVMITTYSCTLKLVIEFYSILFNFFFNSIIDLGQKDSETMENENDEYCS